MVKRPRPAEPQVLDIQLPEQERKLETGSRVRAASTEIRREWTVFEVSATPESILLLPAPGGPAAPASRRRGHLHNTFTFEGSSGVGASRSPCEARFSIIAIRNRNRMTIAVEIQLLSCGRMKQKNLCALKTEL